MTNKIISKTLTLKFCSSKLFWSEENKSNCFEPTYFLICRSGLNKYFDGLANADKIRVNIYHKKANDNCIEIEINNISSMVSSCQCSINGNKELIAYHAEKLLFEVFKSREVIFWMDIDILEEHTNESI